jgi:hypothetical protein
VTHSLREPKRECFTVNHAAENISVNQGITRGDFFFLDQERVIQNRQWSVKTAFSLAGFFFVLEMFLVTKYIIFLLHKCSIQ